MGLKLTTESFLEKARLKHGDKFDYSLVKYITSHIKVKIICSEHGEFEQTSGSHLSGSGCPKCVGKYKYFDKQYFTERARKIHGDKYDYSLVDYIKSNEPVQIICQEHGKFNQLPSIHLSGSGCPKCVGKYKSSEDIINQFKLIHGDKYDYSLVDYQGSHIKVKII